MLPQINLGAHTLFENKETVPEEESLETGRHQKKELWNISRTTTKRRIHS